ncbi:MarR family transcriptional regulator [Lentzea aerocolonigenes]|uniref:MarR family transcriptional regulator n=1 Tax=Lentzea aerocolonigenes TaxID=68170 RepID=UPI001F427F4C|nr:MarR family transcriptional regulator [Lentzea aerocolonigenes]
MRTDAEDKLWEALHAHPNTTATDLAQIAKIGKSTAQKFLAKWAGDGSVTRTAGIATGGRRAADMWAITPSDTNTQFDTADADDATTAGKADAADTSQAELDATAGAPLDQHTPDTDEDTSIEPDSHAPEDAEPPTTTASDTQDSASPEASTLAGADSVVAGVIEPTDSGSSADADPTAEDGMVTAAGKAPRLASGALRVMVEDFLREHAGDEFSPTAIANALGGKSSGAVSNALDKLVVDGIAMKTQDKPRRFALAADEQADAAAPVD